MSAPRVAAAVLAAGASTRFAGATTKLVAPLAQRPVVAWAVRAAVEGGCEPVVLVTGHDAAAVTACAGGLGGVEIVENRAWVAGIATSIRVAIDALGPHEDVTACCIAPGDVPGIGSGAYRRLRGAHAQGAQVAVATYGGRRRHPVLFARSAWPELRRLTGDRGARAIVERAGVDVACDGTGDPTDIDTTDDLRAVEGRWRSTTGPE